jgi:NADH-quinone oxidoreductase subunit N
MNLRDFQVILPLVVLVIWAVILVLVDLWIPKKSKGITAALAVVGMAVALLLCLRQFSTPEAAFNGLVQVDGFAVFLDVIFLGSGIISIGLAFDYLRRMNIERGEYYSLIMISTSGMLLMTYAEDLIVVFLALELLSIPLYVMAGFARLQVESEESALKYFLLGAFSSGFVLYGIALVFGATGSTSLTNIVASVANKTVQMPLFLAGSALLLVGFGFKAAFVPFHMWTPDVYHGAPTSVTAFMSVGAKAAGFAALLRVFVTVFPSLAVDLTPVLWTLAAITMIAGNVIALAQMNIKRLLAYSSIAHAGYMAMAFVSYGKSDVVGNSISSMLFYLVAYSLTTLGAWAVVIALEKPGLKGLDLTDYAGLGKKHPLLGASMTIFMLSYTGIPLTLGFWGKVYLFGTAIQGGFIWLAVIGLLASLVSAYYYLRVIVMMYMKPGNPEISHDLWVQIIAITCALLVVGVSFLPGTLLDWAAQALMILK